jgi:hypothetical protein
MMSNSATANALRTNDPEGLLYIRLANKADMAIAAGDHDLAVLLIEGVFLALDEMACKRHMPFRPAETISCEIRPFACRFSRTPGVLGTNAQEMMQSVK